MLAPEIPLLYRYDYNDVNMGSMASQITSLTIVYSTIYSCADLRKHQSSASLAFVWGIHRSPVISPHKGPVTRKTFPFDDVIMAMYHGDYYHAFGTGACTWTSTHRSDVDTSQWHHMKVMAFRTTGKCTELNSLFWRTQKQDLIPALQTFGKGIHR